MTRLLAALCLSLLLAAPALAELDPGQVGQIQDEQKAAVAKVHAAHGNKSEAELSPAERAQQAREESAASEAVLQKHGVSDKEYTRYTNRMDRSEQAQAKAAQADAQAKREAKKDAPAAPAAKEVEIERGGQEVSHTENGVEVLRGEPSPSAGETARPSSSSRSHRRSHSRHHRRR